MVTGRPHRTILTILPRAARWLGFAGLLPQILVAALLNGPSKFTSSAIGLALAYSALILSFLGGTWWGLAARSNHDAPLWLWSAAVIPSLIGFVAMGAFLTGHSPQPILWVVGVSLIAALCIDYKLVEKDLCPPGWLRLRTPLSIGLGGLTILIAAMLP